MRARCAVTLTLLMAAWPVSAFAEPQGNAGLTLGGAAVGTEGDVSDQAEFHLGLRGDVMFGREESYDFGVGPYAELGTFAFDELQFGTGLNLLLPIHDSLPFVLSAGGYARVGDDDFGVEPGVSGALFWGSRSYNFHASYIIAIGLSVGYRATFGESKESMLLVGLQLDLALMGTPMVALVNIIRGPTDEARPIE